MKIVITAGNGFIGQALCDRFYRDNDVVLITRKAIPCPESVQNVLWDGKSKGDWCQTLEDADVLINLAGKSVDCRYTDENKKLILSSRIDSTNVLSETIMGCKSPPKLWMNSSTATIYEGSLIKEMTEENGDIGSDFSMNIAKSWENAFYKEELPRTRRIAMRISLVLGKNGGVLPVLAKQAKMGLAKRHGSGEQKFSWIHIEDLLDGITYCIKHNEIKGSINFTAPNVTSNAQFLKELRETLKVKIGLPMPYWMLKIGTFVLSSEAELVMKSRNVIPAELVNNGFQFQFLNIKLALKDLLG